MAVGKSVTSVEDTKISPILVDSKTPMSEQVTIFANTKRAQVEIISESEVMTHRAVAAGQPCRR